MPIKTVYQAQIESIQILDEDGQLDAELACNTLSEEDVIGLYELMVISREFDEASFKLQRSGRMGTFPQNKGQEAVSLGAAQAMRRGIDYLVPYYREHPAMFLLGMPMHQVLEYWMGDERANAIGPKLSMNPMSVAIGTQTLHAVGIAWAFKLRKEDRAVLVFFGDGATSTGDFHAAMNFASVFKVPCVFCCVNNGWAISIPCSKQTAATTFAQKALAYNIPTVQVDGNDVFAVYKAHRDAFDRALHGGGPSFIEAITYRLGDHTTADDARRYRDPEQHAAAQARDPLIRTRKYLESVGCWDAQKQATLEERAKVIVHEVSEAALNAAPPDSDELFRYTFETLPDTLLKQMQTRRTDSIGQDPEQIGLKATPHHAETNGVHHVAT